MAELPRTFREAIALTRAMRVDYLWIDSLCIVQDDKDDWERECVTMGQLYERALLVLAAAGSSDSTQGLLDIPRHPELSIEVHPSSPDNQIQGCFNIAVLTDLEASPEGAPLKTRAWAFQELCKS